MQLLRISRGRFQVVHNDISEGSEPALRFYLLVAVSTLIASFGLISNSTAVVIGAMLVAPNRVLKNVMSAGKTRQILAKKRRLCVINEHFEPNFNAVLSSGIVFQHPVKELSYPKPAHRRIDVNNLLPSR